MLFPKNEIKRLNKEFTKTIYEENEGYRDSIRNEKESFTEKTFS